MADTTSSTPRGATTEAPRFAFVHHLDPLRSVQGTRARYDCPDLVAVYRHLASLRRRVARRLASVMPCSLGSSGTAIRSLTPIATTQTSIAMRLPNER